MVVTWRNGDQSSYLGTMISVDCHLDDVINPRDSKTGKVFSTPKDLWRTGNRSVFKIRWYSIEVVSFQFLSTGPKREALSLLLVEK